MPCTVRYIWNSVNKTSQQNHKRVALLRQQWQKPIPNLADMYNLLVWIQAYNRRICIKVTNFEAQLSYFICGIKTGHPFLVEVSGRRWGRWQSHLTEVIAEVRWRASARVWGLKLQPRFGWIVLIRIITRHARILALTYGIAAEMSERETLYSASRRHLGFAVPTRGNTPSREVA